MTLVRFEVGAFGPFVPGVDEDETIRPGRSSVRRIANSSHSWYAAGVELWRTQASSPRRAVLSHEGQTHSYRW